MDFKCVVVRGIRDYLYKYCDLYAGGIVSVAVICVSNQASSHNKITPSYPIIT